ncbi:unnamed protein product [Lymnaea stagnalis]|uniref:RNA helicase n=1 Tax=Lymnaea stagnalis TaxID=6523 RepID=A0AAV2HTJ9_LYMST
MPPLEVTHEEMPPLEADLEAAPPQLNVAGDMPQRRFTFNYMESHITTSHLCHSASPPNDTRLSGLALKTQTLNTLKHDADYKNSGSLSSSDSSSSFKSCVGDFPPQKFLSTLGKTPDLQTSLPNEKGAASSICVENSSLFSSLSKSILPQDCLEIPETMKKFCLGRGKFLCQSIVEHKPSKKEDGDLQSVAHSLSESSKVTGDNLKTACLTTQGKQSSNSHLKIHENINENKLSGQGARPKETKLSLQFSTSDTERFNDAQDIQVSAKNSGQLETSVNSESETSSLVTSGVRGRYRKSGGGLSNSKRAANMDWIKIREAQFQVIEGRRLLETLRATSGQTLPTQIENYPMIVCQDRPLPQPVLGVLVHGIGLPSLACDVSELPFHRDVKKVLENHSIKTAQSIQTFAWAAVHSGRHVVGIAPARHGKTLAYVPGLISELLDEIPYVALPNGKGPIALIVVPNWRKARDVHDHVQKFVGSDNNRKKKIPTIVIYAGGSEDEDTVKLSLLKGCKILISTPNSVLRMLDQEFTSFKRLCHIVLDDAEMLAARFPDEVDEIMQRYKLIIKEYKDLDIPKQIMVFASEWNSNIDRFCLQYTSVPIIVISSRVEASVYGGVKQFVTLLRLNERLTAFCNLLDSLKSDHVVAFSSDSDEVEEMWQAARSRGVYCLIIHEKLSQDTISAARDQWLHSSHTKQLLLMVCTDQCYEDLAITNATCVIHYGLPASKTKFGNRLMCMLDYFIDRTSKIQPEMQPVSHVILTENCANHLSSFYELLQRCPSEYDAKNLEGFLNGYITSLESDPTKHLCPLLKSFGKCMKDKVKCKNRHMFIPEQDIKTGEFSMNTLPPSGEVTLKVIRVENASQYYCHLIEHRSYPNKVRTDLRIEYQRLAMQLFFFYSDENNRVPYVPSENHFEDGLCAFMDEEGSFYRAKVVEVSTVVTYYQSRQYKVWLVDAGCYKIGSIEQLAKLPKSLAEIPYQAIEIFLCNVEPMDNDTEWTDKADIYAHELMDGKILVGRIMLRVGLTLWLRPLVHQQTLKGVGTINDINIRHELLSNHFANPNPNHIKLLYEFFRGKIEIPEDIMQQYYHYSLEIEMSQEILPDRSEYHSVSIAAVINPERLYLHKLDNWDALMELQSRIARTMAVEDGKDSESSPKVDSSIKLELGSVCLAQSENTWYRAKIVSDCGNDIWKVFYLDFGDGEDLPGHLLRPLPRKFSQLPCQAIECQLAYIKPTGAEWSKGASEVILDLSYFVNAVKKNLLAKVVDKSEPVYGMGKRLVVDISNTENMHFSEELVRRHLAVGVDESANITMLLDKPALKSQRFFNLQDKIPFLCANIYWSEDHEESIRQAKELQGILSIRDQGWDVTIEQREVLQPVVKLLGYVADVEAHGIVISSLTACCKDSQILCDLALSLHLPFCLTSCLEQESRPEIQYQATEAIAVLVTLDSFCEYVNEISDLVKTLDDFLSVHQTKPVDLKTLKNLCSSASHLVESCYDKSLCDVLKRPELISQICKNIAMTCNDNEREPWLQLLAAITLWKHTHPSVMREANIDVILQMLTKCVDQKCLYYLLSVCQNLVKGSKKHKTDLLISNLFNILKGLLDKGLKSPALELCESLCEEMNLTLPPPSELTGVPAQKADDIARVVTPDVSWSQSCFRVVITFKVRQAKPEDFTITENRICCSCESGGILYQLDWELYDTVVPAKTKYAAQSSVMLISLAKNVKGQWSRLLKQKTKPPTLSLDYDHIMDSSDEEETEDPNTFYQFKKDSLLTSSEMTENVIYEDRFEPSEESTSEAELAAFSNSDFEEDPVDLERTILTCMKP